MCIGRKKGRSKVLSCGFCLRDLKAEQRALLFLHIHCSNVNSHSSAPKSKRQNLPDRTMDLPFFFPYKDITSLKKVPSLCGYVCFEFLVKRISFVCIR